MCPTTPADVISGGSSLHAVSDGKRSSNRHFTVDGVARADGVGPGIDVKVS